MSRRPRRPRVSWLEPWNLVLFSSILVTDYAFKHFCSRASASELDFLLGPTAAFVQVLSGHAFVAETGAGYVSRDLFVVIAPACAGANFAVVSFTVLGAGFLGRFRSVRQRVIWVALSATLALVTTVLTNALRITLGLVLAQSEILTGMISRSALHRAVGVTVYLVALLTLHATAAWGLRFGRGRVALPLGAYLSVTLLTPLLGGAFASSAFRVHASVVLGATCIVGSVLWLSRRAHEATFTRRVKGDVGDARVSGRLDAARCRGERALPGQGNATLVPRPVG